MPTAECYCTDRKTWDITKHLIWFEAIPRIGEAIEIDGAEWEVRTVLHQTRHMRSSPLPSGLEVAAIIINLEPR